MRAYAFVRYNSGDGAGHVGWGFELPDGRVCVGSVENHSGHLFTPAGDMGFWCEPHYDFAVRMLHGRYDDLRHFEVPHGNYTDAYRVTRWIKESAYRAATRNCEDDVYDVLRMYGVQDLEAPFFNWFPRWWFSRLRGAKLPLAQALHLQCHGEISNRDAGIEASPLRELQALPPLKPLWRRPFHTAANLLTLAKLSHLH